MKKKEKYLAIFLLLAVIISFVVYYRQHYQFAVVCTGFNDLSLSSVDFISNDPQINGKAWVLTVVQNCQGQYAVGTIKANQVQDEGMKAKYDLTIKTNVDEQKCNYPIVYQNTQIKHMNYQTKVCMLGIACDNVFGYNAEDWERDCMSKPGFYAFTKKSASWNYTCFWTTDSAGYGVVGTPSLSFKSTITAEVQGQKVSGVVSNLGPGSVWLGDKVKVVWSGNLVSGDSCPNAGDYHIAAAYVNGAWKTIDNDAYISWKNYNDAGMLNCIDRYQNYGTETPESCTKTYNYYEANALAGKSLVSPGGSVAYAYGTQYDGKVVIDLNKMIQFPVLTMHVKADWLGIYVPIGKPQIVSASMPDFQTGTIAYIKVDVKNVGDGDGSFGVYATCTGGFAQQGGEQYINLAPGAIGTVYIPVTATCNQETVGSCTVVAYDRNQPSSQATSTVSGKCKPIILCSPGSWRCNGQWREQCNQAGSGWNTVEKCNYACEMKGNEAVCSEVNETCKHEGEECDAFHPCCSGLQCSGGLFGLVKGKCVKGGECAWWDIGCHLKNVFGDLVKMFGLILGGIAGILSVAFGRDLFVKERGDKVGWAIVGVIGVLAFLLVWLYWWLFVIILIIYLVIKAFGIGRSK